MENKRVLEFIELLKKEVKPALGCTEPIAVALAVARACEEIYGAGGEISNVEVYVSANILKNGMGVGIPGTGMVGLNIASALAAMCGKSEYRLEVLKEVCKESVGRAKEFVEAKKVKILLAETPIKLYIRAVAFGSNGDVAEATIQDNHDSIVSVKMNGIEQLKSSNSENGESAVKEKGILDYKLSVKEIVEFVDSVESDDVKFILDCVALNSALAEEGLKNDHGLMVGKTIQAKEHDAVFGDTFLTYAMSLTAAASDARMAGSTLPAMSNSGSGNQGIAVTMPVVAYASKMNASEQELAKALVMSHLVAIHIKGHLGKLSALCGCVIASTGASCGIIYLRKGGYEQICSSIKNMIGNISGMVCDGAKVGCALKVASGVSSAIQAAVLAMDGVCISSNDGIIDEDIEKTIANLGIIGSEGMQSTDKMILDIMVSK